MKLVFVASVALLTLSGAANAAIIHDYEFSNDLSDSVAGGVALQDSWRNPATGSVSGGLYTFQQGAGLALTSQLPGSVYTIDMSVSFDAVDGYRKLVSFNDLGSDAGLYILNGTLNLFPEPDTSGAVVTAGVPFDVSISRNAAGLVTGYVNGVQELSYQDTTGAFTASTALYFLRDDTDQNREDSSGSADYIKIYDTATATAAVPEPATWAMMLGGFGLIGGAMRRRRTTVRFA